MRFSRISTAVGLFLISIIIGLAGYVFIEDYSAIDAFYMSVITIGTVGFTEVKELSPNGRLFTSLYILLNIGLYAYSISIVTQYLLEGELKNTFDRLRIQNKINKMKDHVIVSGYGRNGSKAVEELVKNKVKVVVVEKIQDGEASRMKEVENGFISFVSGDATRDETLIAAGIHHARAIISTLPSDADNVYIVLTARELNPSIQIVARATEPHSVAKLKRAGADHIVMPEFIGGLHMASLVTSKLANEDESVRSEIDDFLQFNQLPVSEIPGKISGKSLKEFLSTGFEGMICVGYRSANGKFIFNPDETVAIENDGVLFFVKSKSV